MDKSEEPAETIPTQDDITTETKKPIAGEDLKKHHVKKDQSLLINEENLVQEGVSSSTEEPQQKGSESSIDETETATANESTTLSDKGNAAVKQQDTPGGLHPSEHYVTKTNNGAQEPSSSEDIDISEEKIWEQVCALRAILGYTDATQSSTVDEIKALFVFIGVEPPPSFNDPSDLINVNEMLRILMSIVGIK